MTIIGHAADGTPDPDVLFQSEAVDKHDIARSLAGRARYLYELAVGANPFPREMPACRNPQGNVGHDHSGPPFGSCFLHPVFWWSARKFAGNLITPVNPLKTLSSRAGGNPIGPFVFWARPHTVLPGGLIAPYARLFLYVLAHRDGGVSDCDVTIDLIDAGNGRNVQRTTETMTGIGAGLTQIVTSTAFVGTTPGRNLARITFTPQNDATVTIDAWALCNTVKRRH